MMELNMIRNHIRYRRALRWHDGSVDAIVFRPAEGIIVTGSEDRFMKVKYNVEIQVLLNILNFTFEGVED